MGIIPVISLSDAAEEPIVLSHFSAKSIVVDENQFTDRVFWTMVNGEKGTVVSSTPDGITVIRMSMTQNDSCNDLTDVVCLDATITQVKNAPNAKNGDTLRMIFDLPEKQLIGITSGALETLKVELDIQKLNVKKEVEILSNNIIQKQDSDPIKGVWAPKLDIAVEVAQSPQVLDALEKSNKDFDKFSDIKLLIKERDESWIAVDDNTTTDIMTEVLENEISQLFSNMVEYSQTAGEELLEEIILTNTYGANVAISQRTTDYDQSDEEWWSLAKNRGVYFGSSEFDESSGVESWSMAVRITDQDNRFMGVAKFVVNNEK